MEEKVPLQYFVQSAERVSQPPHSLYPKVSQGTISQQEGRKFVLCTLFSAADFHDARGLPALPDAGREAAGGAGPRPVQEDRRRQVIIQQDDHSG